MNKIIINQKKCYVDKRKLVLNINYNKDNWIFHYDDWGNNTEKYLTQNGKRRRMHIIEAYKYNIQSWFEIPEADGAKLFIDRRYCHNHSFNIYFRGKTYLIGKEKRI